MFKFLPFRTNLFDNVFKSNNVSDLPCPFIDVIYSKEFENKSKTKQIYGKDLYGAFSFSSKFKSAMESVKKENKEHECNYLKANSAVDEIFELSSSAVKSETEKMFDFNTVEFAYIAREAQEVEEEEKEKNGMADSKKKSTIWLDEDEFFDTMSGYWRMLSVFEEFRISPPWYDAYAEGKMHWLQTQPVSKEVLEYSRVKCLNWLGNHNGC